MDEGNENQGGGIRTPAAHASGPKPDPIPDYGLHPVNHMETHFDLAGLEPTSIPLSGIILTTNTKGVGFHA